MDACRGRQVVPGCRRQTRRHVTEWANKALLSAQLLIGPQDHDRHEQRDGGCRCQRHQCADTAVPPPPIFPHEQRHDQSGRHEHAEIPRGEHGTQRAGADGDRVARTALSDEYVKREDREWEPEQMQNLKM